MACCRPQLPKSSATAFYPKEGRTVWGSGQQDAISPCLSLPWGPEVWWSGWREKECGYFATVGRALPQDPRRLVSPTAHCSGLQFSRLHPGDSGTYPAHLTWWGKLKGSEGQGRAGVPACPGFRQGRHWCGDCHLGHCLSRCWGGGRLFRC